MCIMEVHAKAANATQVQAMLHNCRTQLTDLDMMVSLYTARSDSYRLDQARECIDDLSHAQDCLKAWWEREVASVMPEDIQHTHRDGSERSRRDIIHAIQRYARKDYSR